MSNLEAKARKAVKGARHEVAVDELTSVLIHNLRELGWPRSMDKTNEVIHRLQTYIGKK